MNIVSSYPYKLVYIGALFKTACYNGAMQKKMETAQELQALLTSLYNFNKFSAII